MLWCTRQQLLLPCALCKAVVHLWLSRITTVQLCTPAVVQNHYCASLVLADHMLPSLLILALVLQVVCLLQQANATYLTN